MRQFLYGDFYFMFRDIISDLIFDRSLSIFTYFSAIRSFFTKLIRIYDRLVFVVRLI